MIAILTALIIASGTAPPQATEPPEPLLVAVETIPILYFTILVHESGHALMGKALRLNIGKFQPYPTMCGDSFAYGCTTLNERSLTKKQRILFSSGGILATRLSAEGIDFITNRIPDERARLKQTMSILYFIMRLDMPRYIIVSAIRSWSGHPAGKANDVQRLVSGFTLDSGNQKIIYVGLVAFAIVDLLIDWKELRTNWNRVWMKGYDQHNTQSMDNL